MNTLIPEDLTSFVYQSHAASLQLAHVSTQDKNRLLAAIAQTLKENRNHILEANTLDLEASREMAVPDLVLEWLKLTPERLQNAIDCLQHLIALPDPLSQNFDRDGYVRVPLGTVSFVYEAFPQLSIVAAGMCLKVGNSLILKGGSETTNSNMAIAEIVKEVITSHNFPAASVMIAPQGSATKDLLTQEKYLRLIIPYGRPSFVQQICKQATVSVLPTAMGNCYLYLAPTGNLEQATRIIKASRQGDPDPVNAIEKVIVHRCWLEAGFLDWIASWQKQGLKVRGCDVTVAFCRKYSDLLIAEVAPETQWGQAYLDQILTVKVVDSIEESIAWINQYSSGHADVILTDSLKESHQFTSQVNSSTVFVNINNRFTRYGGFGENTSSPVPVSLGMSSLKTRGASRYPGTIDINALTTTKMLITG